MSEPSPKSVPPSWLAGAVVGLLTAQLALLWMQGSLLERQHGELQGLRQDVQELTESLDDAQGTYDQGSFDGKARPSRDRHRQRRQAVLVRLQEGGGDAGVRKELEDQRKSEREALDKARDVREKLSLEENARKADEKKQLEAPANRYRALMWAGAALVLVILAVRSWLGKRG